MIRRSPALPKIRRTMIWSMASSAWRRLSQTKTPLPAARPSALSTRPSGRPRTWSRASAGRREHALLPALLDLDLDARAEHLARVHDPVDRLEGLGGGPAEEGVAERRAAVRADDQRDLAREHVMLGVGGRAEDAVIGRRDAGLPHQVLGEDLAPLQLGRVLARAEDLQPLALEGVDDPLGQRLLGPDDGQPDPLLAWRTGPGRGSRPARSATFCASRAVPALPGAQKTAGDPRRLLELPAEGVLPPPFSHHEDFQGTDPHSG